MFFAGRPSQQTIDRFVEQSKALPLSYHPVGIAEGSSTGFDLDDVSVTIGRGGVHFERARAALFAWRHFALGWLELFPRDAAVEPGRVVAVLIRHLGFWSLNGCRVLYGIGERERGTRCGFAYGTLINHAERGEEIFEVSLHPDSDEVVYRIRAASQARAVLARAAYPVTRALQAKFRRDSAAALRHAIRQGAAGSPL